MSTEENITPALPARDDESAVMVIPRAIFNYIVIAVVFLVVGVVIGMAASGGQAATDTRALIDQAVTAALNAQTDRIAQAVEQAMAAAQPPSLDDPSSRFAVSAVEDDPTMGADDPIVTIIEFSDFNCSYCGRWANSTLYPLVEKYGDRVRFVYRDYPILADSSLTAALAAQCAQDQGKFWDYHNILFSNQGRFSRDNLVSYAAQLEMDTDEFGLCLDEQRHLSRVAGDYQVAQGLGVRGTPAFFINGRPISGAQPIQVFETIIEEELAAAQGSGEPAS